MRAEQRGPTFQQKVLANQQWEELMPEAKPFNTSGFAEESGQPCIGWAVLLVETQGSLSCGNSG